MRYPSVRALARAARAVRDLLSNGRSGEDQSSATGLAAVEAERFAALEADLQTRLNAQRRDATALADRLAAAEADLADYRRGWPPGHFYSPIPSLDEVRARESAIFKKPSSLGGIELFERKQLELVEILRAYAVDQPFKDRPTAEFRYHYDNEFFGHGDGIVLHCMLRHLRPARLVEIGSGYTSALMLDTNEAFLSNTMRCTFIEPYTDRLRQLIGPGNSGQAEILETPLQDVGLDVFTQLQAGDVLFIDSSHVAKIGSDVNRIMFEILPILATGVYVHFHDIFYPFEYSKEWVYEGRAWNEAYLLRAFLEFNECFQIRLFNAYLAEFHHDQVAAALPPWAENTGGSIWLERVSA